MDWKEDGVTQPFLKRKFKLFECSSGEKLLPTADSVWSKFPRMNSHQSTSRLVQATARCFGHCPDVSSTPVDGISTRWTADYNRNYTYHDVWFCGTCTAWKMASDVICVISAVISCSSCRNAIYRSARNIGTVPETSGCCLYTNRPNKFSTSSGKLGSSGWLVERRHRLSLFSVWRRTVVDTGFFRNFEKVTLISHLVF